MLQPCYCCYRVDKKNGQKQPSKQSKTGAMSTMLALATNARLDKVVTRANAILNETGLPPENATSPTGSRLEWRRATCKGGDVVWVMSFIPPPGGAKSDDPLLVIWRGTPEL